MKDFQRKWFLVVFLAMAIVPALAQHESVPVRPGDSRSKTGNPSDSNARAALKQQIADQVALLDDYRRQIQVEATLVEHARQLLISPEGSADEAGESVALSICEKELQALERFLEDPIRVAEANLASLESKHAALMASATDRASAIRHASRRERVQTALSSSGSTNPVKHGGPSLGSAEASTKDAETVKHTVALNH